MPEDRFFLGYGERLTERVTLPSTPNDTQPAYSFDEAVTRLRGQVAGVADALETLPARACPGGDAVGVITLHPQWVSKSAHPQRLLTEYNLRQVGSRPVEVHPEKWTRQRPTESAASTSLYVAGSRESFRRWAEDLSSHPGEVSDQIQRVEAVRAPTTAERLRNLPAHADRVEPVLLEVVLHAAEKPSDDYILAGFQEYAATVGAFPDLDRRLHAGGLCFMPVEADEQALAQLAQFAFLRVARPMPRLRTLPSIERARPAAGLPPAPLPTEPAIDTDLRIAVFDGGLSPSSELAPWATGHDGKGVQTETASSLAHGHDVTSAVLFGSLTPGQPAPRPYGVVDHYRVLDNEAEDDLDLFEVLRRILDVLRTRRHQFVNLSIGPALPVDDDEVHTWTSVLDEHLADGDTLLTAAVGNTGEQSQRSEARIQVPSDCVNALAVGACNSVRPGWSRAPYSSYGPGRSPGLVKPDVLAFGGDEAQEQFLVYDRTNAPALATTNGTSFSAPAALRLAAGLRAHFGDRLSPIALKTLLIHSAAPDGQPRTEAGWGRLPPTVEPIAICGEGMVRVIYQGELNPSQYLRAPLPLPDHPLAGFVQIDATLCYATSTDPADPGTYTRSGLQVTFRPHATKYASEESVEPAPKPFFGSGMTGDAADRSEQALRADAHKWETVLNSGKRMRAPSLLRPVFDIHYNARTGGGVAQRPENIRYAMVITVRCPRTPDLYDHVVRTFAGQLEVLAPVAQIPVRI